MLSNHSRPGSALEAGLGRYRDRMLTFNDNIQGTAAVALGALSTATTVAGSRLTDHRIVVLGAGSTAIGGADMIRTAPRRGHAKAIKAVEHSMVVAIHHMLDRRQPYHDLGGDYFAQRQSPQRQAAHHLDKVRELGYPVTAGPPSA